MRVSTRITRNVVQSRGAVTARVIDRLGKLSWWIWPESIASRSDCHGTGSIRVRMTENGRTARFRRNGSFRLRLLLRRKRALVRSSPALQTPFEFRYSIVSGQSLRAIT
jgi:hypothetical protein